MESEASHHIYLVPGMFGFAELAGYDYFVHVEEGLSRRLDASGIPHTLTIVPTPPTASIRRRAQVLAEKVYETARRDSGPIHLIGHSTGGLDARLLASPTSFLDLPKEALAWRDRLETVVSLNTPHYGTPLAGFFATVSGARLLYVLSLLTVTTLTLGGPPLTALTSLIAIFGRLDDIVGVDSHLLDRVTELLLKILGKENRDEVRRYLEGIRKDQGAVIQLTPEAMDIFNAAAEDADDVRYGSIVTSAPPPAPKRFIQSVRSPYAAISATIYSTLYTITARAHERYPYPSPDHDTFERIRRDLGKEVTSEDNDGVVPTLSMIWGDVIWAGRMDHLDVVGHFPDDQEPKKHTDWLTSGAQCDRSRFDAAMNALASFLIGDR